MSSQHDHPESDVYSLADVPAAPLPPFPVISTHATRDAEIPTTLHVASNSPSPASTQNPPAHPISKSDSPVPAPTPSDSKETPKPRSGGFKLQPKRGQKSYLLDIPAWLVSIIVHLGVLSVMGAVTVSSIPRQEVNLDAVPFDPALLQSRQDELTPILADPLEAPRDQAVQDQDAVAPGPSTGLGTTLAGAPSATPRISNSNRVGPRTSLPDMPAVRIPSPAASLPPNLARDLGQGGLIAGDVTRKPTDIGQALDELSKEILRQLQAHKLLVVWLFDESGSMRDDQQAIRDQFHRVANDLKLHVDQQQRDAGALLHAIVGFGKGIDFEQRKPTDDIDLIAKAITRLKIDETGSENTFQAMQAVIAEYGRLISRERRMMIVLVTDESGDDDDHIEETRQLAISRGIPVYVIGRQSLFGKTDLVLPYKDNVTGDVYYPTIRRGPETADLEAFQWDGLHPRWDEQPSGFAPYALARLVKDSGGIYFLLPSEEFLRITQREKAYSMATLKEYVPDYESRITYAERRAASPFRSTIYDLVKDSRQIATRIELSIPPAEFLSEAAQGLQEAEIKITTLFNCEKRLRDPRMVDLRDREIEKRWQAAYDLTLAQVVAYQVKQYEYRACLIERIKQYQSGKPPIPNQKPAPDLDVRWHLVHSTTPKAPEAETAKKYAEARALLEKVIKNHPNTPWADLAQDELNRGLSVQWSEVARTARYMERMKFVPKF
jgi:hypothetical protein